jgi:hypothetical protein
LRLPCADDLVSIAKVFANLLEELRPAQALKLMIHRSTARRASALQNPPLRRLQYAGKGSFDGVR